ncbi:MAG TPA: extracellular solute-binding protein [Beijerinckiaceae bacterium]|nr:extracellular solute-binding protein [Beijerinckiaceae bacterium]
MKTTRPLLAALAALLLASAPAIAGCAFENKVPVKVSAAAFPAWKAVTSAMAECGNVQSELSQEFQDKQAAGFAARPSLYHIGGVANSSLVQLVNQGLVHPLDDLVARFGQKLRPNQLIRVDGKIVAIAMMANAQHLMYRKDIFDALGIAVPETYEDLLAAADRIQKANPVKYPFGGTWKTTWLEFVNVYMGYVGEFFTDRVQPAINNPKGIAALEMLRKLTAYMDPEYLVSDATYVQQQFQQGRIAMANYWASRAAALDDPKELQVVGKVAMAAAPAPEKGLLPASTLWWDGIVIARNISYAEAEAALKVTLEGMDTDMVKASNSVAIGLIEGYAADKLATGAQATAAKGAKPYPASTQMGLMQKAIANKLNDILKGSKDARTTLADIEADYRVQAKEAGLL